MKYAIGHQITDVEIGDSVEVTIGIGKQEIPLTWHYIRLITYVKEQKTELEFSLIYKDGQIVEWVKRDYFKYNGK